MRTPRLPESIALGGAAFIALTCALAAPAAGAFLSSHTAISALLAPAGDHATTAAHRRRTHRGGTMHGGGQSGSVTGIQPQRSSPGAGPTADQLQRARDMMKRGQPTGPPVPTVAPVR